MAVIPNLDISTVENPGRRSLYQAVLSLPEDYTALWGFQFRNQITAAVIWEADLVIIHPYKGFLLFQVVEGEAGFFNGRWHYLVQGKYRELEQDPVESARQAMYQVVTVYREKYGFFPLSFDFGLCFPDCTNIEGQPPAFVRPDNMILGRDLDNFSARVAGLFRQMPRDRQDGEIIRKLVDILTANFRLYNTLEEHIKSFTLRSELRFTEEQQRILEETELNRRLVFYGAAGTGKTMLAVEKARRLATEGQRVLLTCFNRPLASQFPSGVENLTAIHFHGLLEQVTGLSRPKGESLEHFYEKTLPGAGLKFFEWLAQEQKYDAIIVDEGQDFRPHWFRCLEAALKPDGWYYVFADSSQNIFGVDPSGLEGLPASKFRLTINLRNTVSICQDWIKPLSGAPLRLGIKETGELHFHSWSDDREQRQQLEKVVSDLTARGVSPRRITILSPHRRENSCLAEITKLAGIPLGEVGDPRPDVLRFSTIRAFKGLEADVVLLIGVRPDSPVCSKADLYVGGSRARYALHVFHRKDWREKVLS